MERLTTKTSIMGRKHDIAYGCASIWKKKLKNDKYELIENAVDKLGELEDIEGELGIDLVVYFKIISATHIYTKQGKCNVYKIETRRKAKELRVVLSGKWIGHPEIHNELILPFSLYGKTWALTKEELLKEN